MSLKFKRHHKLIVLLLLVLVVAGVGWGDQGLVAYTVRGSDQALGAGYVASLSLFDSAPVDGVGSLVVESGY